MRIPCDAKITFFARYEDKTVIRWRDGKGKSHTATQIHTPGQVESVRPEDDAGSPW